MKVAIYARYSSENQRDASIGDQFRICREFAQRQGWHIAGEYSDHAVSGATLMRPGFQAMMARSAAQKKVDVVLAEALDRFSRDQEDTAGLFKRLTFAGVSIVTLAEGDITFLHIGLKGTMNAMFLKELADKTRRGLRGRVELGKAGGGVSFGYRIVRTVRERRRLDRRARDRARGSRHHPAHLQATTSAGASPKQIAKDSESRRVCAARVERSGVRARSTATRSAGIGILHNELYIGRMVWNRQRFLKDPDTGKRVVTAEPGIRVGDQRRARSCASSTTNCGRRCRRDTRPFSSKWTKAAEGQALQPVPSPEVPVLRSDEVRRVRRRLRRLLARPPRMLRHPRPRHVHQQADDLASGSRGARADARCRTS